MDNIFFLIIMVILLLEIPKKYLFLTLLIASIIYYLYLRKDLFIRRGNFVSAFTEETINNNPNNLSYLNLDANNVKPEIPITSDNPFANNLPFLEKGDSPFNIAMDLPQFSEQALKPYLDTNENKEMRDLYYEDVYRPLEDYYDKKSAYRQFYNNPDRDGFVEFVYGDMKSCKDTATNCFPYYDNRYNRY